MTNPGAAERRSAGKSDRSLSFQKANKALLYD